MSIEFYDLEQTVPDEDLVYLLYNQETRDEMHFRLVTEEAFQKIENIEYINSCDYWEKVYEVIDEEFEAGRMKKIMTMTGENGGWPLNGITIKKAMHIEEPC